MQEMYVASDEEILAVYQQVMEAKDSNAPVMKGYDGGVEGLLTMAEEGMALLRQDQCRA
ncbi:hypothetical protein FACS1894139_16740 [Planctomycetales bacterium]|nr:hypothetical protein FACS1894107_12600 [Planctomycetales bacterium]GHS98739.1 hypothetical protein FACS1894108_07440 [Planctomycetales bacterium]GHT07844.1 hypothetical protein FACS1894139_16740 [Planctomycetales bacterium]